MVALPAAQVLRWLDAHPWVYLTYSFHQVSGYSEAIVFDPRKFASLDTGLARLVPTCRRPGGEQKPLLSGFVAERPGSLLASREGGHQEIRLPADVRLIGSYAYMGPVDPCEADETWNSVDAGALLRDVEAVHAPDGRQLAALNLVVLA